MDFEQLVKDAAIFGIAVGVVAMAAFIAYYVAQYFLRPAVAVAAATAVTPSVGFGFQCP